MIDEICYTRAKKRIYFLYKKIYKLTCNFESIVNFEIIASKNIFTF